MRHWTFWEWVAYSCLFVAAIIVAAETGFKIEPEVMAHLPGIFHSPIWGFAPSILVIFATCILLLREFVFPRTVSVQAANALPSASVRPTLYIKDAHIYAGSDQPVPLNPRFVATFIRNGQRGRLYVEDRYYPSGLMGPHGWIFRPMMLLAELKDFVIGQSLDIAILTPFDNSGRRMWRWVLQQKKSIINRSYNLNLRIVAD